MTRVSAVVVNHNGEALIEACLRSLGRSLEECGVGYELLVVDNGSTDRSRALVSSRFPAVRLVEREANEGFAAGVNAGLAAATGDWVLLVNNDMTLAPSATREMLLAVSDRSRIGSVAAQVRFASDPSVINSAGIGVDKLGVAFDRHLGDTADASEREPVPVFGASAGAALYRRQMLDELGGFDDMFFLYLEDVDLAWRARMHGWDALYVPTARATHHHSATSGHGSQFKYFHVGRSRMLLLAKNLDTRQLVLRWPSIVAYDLAYVTYVAIRERTLAPLRGRLTALPHWRALRRLHAAQRRPLALSRPPGLRSALGRQRVWRRHSHAAQARARGSPPSDATN